MPECLHCGDLPTWVTLGWLPTLVLALVLLGSVSMAIHGRELVWLGFRYIFATDSVPDTLKKMDVVTLKPSAPGVRHFIYSEPECMKLIVEWIHKNRAQPTERHRG